MHRFYASDDGITDGMAQLSPEDAHHALNVLRLKPGCEIQVFSHGKPFLAEIFSAEAGLVQVRITNELPSTEAKLRITLCQGLAKAEKMEMIIQKAVEIGADSVIPVIMSRSVVRLDQKDAAKKTERWQKIAREASKQSGRCSLMNVHSPVTLKQAAEQVQKLDRVIVPWEEEHAMSLTSFHNANTGISSLGIVIGPEGGISQEEIRLLHQETGAVPVTLGKRILRTETAGLCAMSALFCLYGDME